jgi:hypothetical protein
LNFVTAHLKILHIDKVPLVRLVAQADLLVSLGLKGIEDLQGIPATPALRDTLGQLDEPDALVTQGLLEIQDQQAKPDFQDLLV